MVTTDPIFPMDLADITATIRVDAATNKGSVIDVIRLVIGCDASSANTALTKLKKEVGELGGKIPQLRINGKGRLTPVADARTLVEIVWLLPGKAAREFRRKSAATVCRFLGGDLSLVAEIEAKHAHLQSSEGGTAVAEFLVVSREEAVELTPSACSTNGVGAHALPVELSLASEEDRREYARDWIAHRRAEMRQTILEREDEHRIKLLRTADELREGRVRTLHGAHELMKSIGLLDDRDVIEFKDRARTILSQKFECCPVGEAATPLLIEAAAEVDPGRDVPTPECSATVRGDEISMHTVASELGLRVGDKAGHIGKVARRLYAERYGEGAAAAIPKRMTFFRGKPWAENTYYARDADLITSALRAVLQS